MFAKNGRYGPYVQWGTPDEPPPGFDKPKMSSLFKTMVLERITLDEAMELLQLPRTLGVDPADGEDDHRQQRPLRPLRPEGSGLPQPRQRGAAAHGDARRRAARSSPSRRCTGAAGRTWPPRVRSREFGTDPVSRAAGRRPGRQVRGVRHRRRDERVDRQGRPHRRDAPRAGLRAAGDPPRDRGRQGWRPGEAQRPARPRPRRPPPASAPRRACKSCQPRSAAVRCGRRANSDAGKHSDVTASA